MSDLLERGEGVSDVPEEINQLEETVRMTSICGLGQVAMGPLLSVMGMDRGGAEAREHPKDPEDTEK
jgi:NADH:ubiquinone oxidoreductase subunit F (NADH-binding)